MLVFMFGDMRDGISFTDAVLARERHFFAAEICKKLFKIYGFVTIPFYDFKLSF